MGTKQPAFKQPPAIVAPPSLWAGSQAVSDDPVVPAPAQTKSTANAATPLTTAQIDAQVARQRAEFIPIAAAANPPPPLPPPQILPPPSQAGKKQSLGSMFPTVPAPGTANQPVQPRTPPGNAPAPPGSGGAGAVDGRTSVASTGKQLAGFEGSSSAPPPAPAPPLTSTLTPEAVDRLSGSRSAATHSPIAPGPQTINGSLGGGGGKADSTAQQETPGAPVHGTTVAANVPSAPPQGDTHAKQSLGSMFPTVPVPGTADQPVQSRTPPGSGEIGAVDRRTNIASTGKQLAGFEGSSSTSAKDLDVTDPGKLGAIGQARDPNVRHPSDFMSFGEYASKNQNALREMADRAANDVTSKRMEERDALLRTRQAAEMGFGNLKEGAGYDDYLRARFAADKAQEAAQISQSPSNASSYEMALRGIYGGQQQQRLDAQQKNLSAVEARVAEKTDASQKQRRDADAARRAAENAENAQRAQQAQDDRESMARKVAKLAPEIDRAMSGVMSPTGALRLTPDGTIRDPRGAVYELREDGSVWAPDGSNIPVDDRLAGDIKAAAHEYHRWF